MTEEPPISRPISATPLAEMLARMVSRRAVLGAGVALAALPAFAKPPRLQSGPKKPVPKPLFPPAFPFPEVPHGNSETHLLPPGYKLELLARWGDPVLPGAPAFDPLAQSPEAQALQFGFNNDYTAYLPLESSARGLLWVNHEYSTASAMFPPAWIAQAKTDKAMRARLTGIGQAAQGGSVLEIVRKDGKWGRVSGSRYARRITATTPIALSGPAAGDARLRTEADPTGCLVTGTLANCAGGVTPWGTVLTCEENINYYFRFDPRGTNSESRNHTRLGLGDDGSYGWWESDARFDAMAHPHEPNRFGWVVEVDPRDPTSQPVKRTALGRFKHESANCVLAPDGRVAIYMGDDQMNEYFYRFVSAEPFTPGAPNRDLLDHGTLSVARFDEDGTITWLPLIHGEGPLTSANGFTSQADVLIEARRAGDLLGATPMDRVEDVEPSPQSGRIYLSLTMNIQRKEPSAANPRLPNPYGHILEIIPPTREGGPDHAGTRYDWALFLLAGDPREAGDKAFYLAPPSEQGWLTNPDNLAFDPTGNLWIATDGQRASKGICDHLYVTPMGGPWRGRPHSFFRGPAGAELTGPTFTPDGTTLFLSIQHPGEPNPGQRSGFAAPSTRWPDFSPTMPPRPSMVAITRADGGIVGS